MTKRHRVSLRKNKSADAQNAYTVTTHNGLTGEIEVKNVHTNEYGNGLWIDGQQIEGTCQFEFKGAHSYRAYFYKLLQAFD